ncbi:MAG: formate dehydrogenase accessory sulfurtransferase FdhD [Gemmatimonadales bacterium]|nr:formate dehydrogenase accessory sulfurtransferase FdhD [Gemmatimonadales bacterium]
MTEPRQGGDPDSLARLGFAEPLLEHGAIRWSGNAPESTIERIAEEIPVALVYNGTPHVVMMATPQDLEDFALGFSFTEELVGAAKDLLDVEVVRYSRGIELQLHVEPSCMAVIESRNRRLTGRTGCGICGAESFDAVLKRQHTVQAGGPFRIGAIRRALGELEARQALNALVGAVHAAGWATAEGAVQMAREDVGRHNALDKLIGALLKAGVNPASGFLVVTSRASFEMAQKATAFGAPLLAAISGPTALAVRVAAQAGLTLIGFARGTRHTVYTHSERVIGGD